MKVSMTRRYVRWLIVPGAIALAAVSSGFVAGDRGTSVTPYDGEAVFRGVFFGQGPVGALLPEIWAGRGLDNLMATREQSQEVRRIREGVVARIRADDPAFFDRFAVAMQSGQHLQIRRAMDEGSDRLARALEGVDGEHLLNGAVVREDDGKCLVVLLVGAYVAVYYKVYLWPNAQKASSNLMRDQVTHMVATRLATMPAAAATGG